MIGASNSPLNAFVPTNSGPSMYDIGLNSGPAGAISNALRTVAEQYNAHIAAQQEQQNALDLAQGKGAIDLGNEKSLFDYKQKNAQPDPDAAGPITQVDPNTKKSFIRSTSIDPATGQSKVSWAPVSINAPERPIDQITDLTAQPILEQLKAALAQRQEAGNMIQQSATGMSTPSVKGQGVMPSRDQIMQAKAQGYTHYDTSTGKWLK